MSKQSSVGQANGKALEDEYKPKESYWSQMDPERRKRRTLGEQRRRNHVAAAIKELGNALANVGVPACNLSTQADILTEAIMLIKSLSAFGTLMPPAVDHPRTNQISAPLHSYTCNEFDQSPVDKSSTTTGEVHSAGNIATLSTGGSIDQPIVSPALQGQAIKTKGHERKRRRRSHDSSHHGHQPIQTETPPAPQMQQTSIQPYERPNLDSIEYFQQEELPSTFSSEWHLSSQSSSYISSPIQTDYISPFYDDLNLNSTIGVARTQNLF